ncbi:MAG: DUF2780 domain-containing protein [Methylomonas sp.]|nr:DUF2780 domain-containing protein [Methylomonas sp.]
MKSWLYVVAVLMVVGGVACTPGELTTDHVIAEVPSSTVSAEAELVVFLVERLGIEPKQAMGGLGSVFAFARQRMTPEDFMRLSASVPDMDDYLSAVPTLPSAGSWLGPRTNIAGASAMMTRFGVLAESFQALGMDADMPARFVPVVLQYLRDQSELLAMSLLQNAF